MAKLAIYHGAARPMVAVGVHQCRLLSFVERYHGWHAIGFDRASLRAVKALERKGYIEVSGDMMRISYPSQEAVKNG